MTHTILRLPAVKASTGLSRSPFPSFRKDPRSPKTLGMSYRNLSVLVSDPVIGMRGSGY